MLLLISDANILIDMEEGQLIEQMFRLPWTFSVPDILFVEELQAQHAYLMEKGLQVGELTPDSMLYAFQLSQRSHGPSRNDCFALALAQQKKCSPLTGDKNLRKAAEAEGVVVMGTIWIVNRMVNNRLITIEQAKEAYQKMKDAGRRLPWDEAFFRLETLQKELNT